MISLVLPIIPISQDLTEMTEKSNFWPNAAIAAADFVKYKNTKLESTQDVHTFSLFRLAYYISMKS